MKKAPFFAITTLLLASATSASAEESGEPRTKAEWKAALYGRSTDDSQSASRTAGAAGIVRLQHRLHESLEAFLQGGASFESGSASSLFTNEFEPRSRLFLQEASLRWRAWGPASLKAGALDQQHHQSPLLISGGTFPAAMAILDWRPEGGWLVKLDGQAAIPTSRTLSTRATGKETTPTLFTQKIVLGWSDPEAGAHSLLRASRFQYRNLTRGIAQDSRFYGNTVTGIGAASRFRYAYEGFEAGPDLSWRLFKGLSLQLGGSYLQNTSGPRSTDEGAYAYAGLEIQTETFSLAPKFEWYRNQADSAPAFFNSAEFGHNNRKGAGASLKLALPKAGIEIELKGRRTRLLNSSAFQRDRFDYLELSVEVPYAGF